MTLDKLGKMWYNEITDISKRRENMKSMDEFISLQDAIDEATKKLGSTSTTVKILNAVMDVMLTDDYYPQEVAIGELEELCR